MPGETEEKLQKALVRTADFWAEILTWDLLIMKEC
jgi:hypothetical protein